MTTKLRLNVSAPTFRRNRMLQRRRICDENCAEIVTIACLQWRRIRDERVGADNLSQFLNSKIFENCDNRRNPTIAKNQLPGHFQASYFFTGGFRIC